MGFDVNFDQFNASHGAEFEIIFFTRKKDMKKRIVALILTVVMSLLALTSCGSFNFAEEDLTSYASFDYAAFKAALQALEIEDGDFTTDEATREKLVQSKIYNTIADKIITATKEADRVTKDQLGKGDVLYFVYYAVDADGNVYYTSEMKESTITSTTAAVKNRHVIKLGETNQENKLYVELVKNLVEVENLADYIYDMAEKADLTDDELTVKAGDTIVISYSRSYEKTDDDGAKVTVTETAAYETITLSAESEIELVKKFLEEGAVAKVGSNLAVKNGDSTSETFEITEGETTYKYSNVKVQWKVKTAGQPIATFKYTPTEKTEVTPDNCRPSTAGKVDLKDKELTYYVYPVYAIHTPAIDEITATDILVYVYGGSLKDTSFEAFEDETYANGDKKLADLLKDAANVYATSDKDNAVYGEGTELKKLLDAYNEAYKISSASGATTEQKETTTKAQEALTEAQRAAFKVVAEKIAACTNGTKTLGDEILEEYEHNTEHSLKETYDSEIAEKIQTAVWNLIDKSVVLSGNYPEKLVKEYKDHLYESYEYEYYKGDFSSTVKNIDKYENLNAYLVATLKLASIDELDAALVKEAKAAIDPIIKIFVVAKACEADAVAALPGYIEADINGGVYNVSLDAYIDAYGDKGQEKYDEAVKAAEESKQSARDEATMFLVDDAYMNSYKKEVGRAYYRSVVEQYGEINLRAAFQFNRLFYYLTSTNVHLNEDGDHTEVNYVDGKLDFRTVKYTLKADK